MVLGVFMIVSALTGVNVALMQDTPSDTTNVVATVANAVPATTLGDTKHVVGIRLSAGGWSNSYNDALWQGVTNALRETPFTPSEIVLFDETSTPSSDVNLLFTAAPTDTTAANTTHLIANAKSRPATQFVVVDSSTATSTLPNLHEISFEESQASYLLGYVAGTLTQTGQVGFIGDTQTARTLANQAAFSQGLKAACSLCKLNSEFLGSSNDVNLGTAAAQRLTSRGADILFTDAKGSSQGVITYVNNTMCASAVKTRPSPLTSALTMIAKNINYLSRCATSYPLFFIGNAPYPPSLGDNDDDPTSLNHGLTSLAKHVDVAVYATTREFFEGNTPQSKQLSLKDGAVGITIDDYNRALLSEEVLAQLEDVKAQLISGEIRVSDRLEE